MYSNMATVKGVSILMPVYNGIEFMAEAVQSVMSQVGAPEWELLVGINGHPPSSAVYVRAQALAQTPNMKVYDFPALKGGKVATLIKLRELSQFPFIAFLDVDDVWLPNKLAMQIQALVNGKYDVVGSQCVYFGYNRHLNGKSPNIPVGNISLSDFVKKNPLINSSVVMRKELATWSLHYPLIEDYELWLRLRYGLPGKRHRRLPGTRFFNFSQVLVKHRLHPTSYFNSRNKTPAEQLTKQYYAYRSIL